MSIRSLQSTSSKAVRASMLLVMFPCAWFSAAAMAQTLPSSSSVAQQAVAPSVAGTMPVKERPLVKPGDRTCLRQTGSLIPPKKGDCLPVAGRSYSGTELRNTGVNDNARALQMLDPSISRGH